MPLREAGTFFIEFATLTAAAVKIFLEVKEVQLLNQDENHVLGSPRTQREPVTKLVEAKGGCGSNLVPVEDLGRHRKFRKILLLCMFLRVVLSE